MPPLFVEAGLWREPFLCLAHDVIHHLSYLLIDIPLTSLLYCLRLEAISYPLFRIHNGTI